MKLIYKKIFAYISLFAIHSIHTTVEWSGTDCFNVTDEDVIINGDCQIQEGSTSISAATANITITVPHDTVISAIDSFDPNLQPTSLITLRTTYPYSITIQVKKSLTFKGTPGIKEMPIQVFVIGS
jgi:hypothetical protein